MHSLDVDFDVLAEFQPGAEVCDQVTGRERCLPSVVDVDAVRRGRRQLVPVECGVAAGDDRPCVRVGGGFAGEVAGVEFRDGGVEVVEVERDDRDDPLVGVDLDDAEHIGEERLGTFVADARIGYARGRGAPRGSR